jgi:carbon storage regulator CsrA
MLILKRKKKESIFIDGATVSVLHLGEENVTLGIVAPREMRVLRSELVGNDDDVLTREDRKRNSFVARLHGMPEERRNKIIAQIVREFCSPKSIVQTDSPAVRG